MLKGIDLMTPIKIVHIITGLNSSGAENMLYRLVKAMDISRFDQEVVSLMDIGTVGIKISELGIPVMALNMKRGIPDLIAMAKLRNYLSRRKPDVIQTWMYHADLIGGVAGYFAGQIPIFWGIRHTNLDAGMNKRSTIITARLCASLSSVLPRKIICCSESARVSHVRFGYDPNKIAVIPNGFEINNLKASEEFYHSVRDELMLSYDTLIIGLVARYDVQKDHENFFAAAALLNNTDPTVQFVLCGEDVTWENSLISDQIHRYGLESCVHLMGKRKDVLRITASFDIATLSSMSEGFPNVVGEAMACEVPCVVTDVGDAAYIVGNTGFIVPPRDPVELADGWRKMIRMGQAERRKLGQMARMRIVDNYDIKRIAEQYAAEYNEIFSG